MIHVSTTNVPLDVAMATFPPVCLPETNLCAQQLLRERLCKWILPLNCTAALCPKCVNSYYYSGASAVFSSLCLQHSHVTAVPSGACVITVLLQLGSMHYAASEAEVQSAKNTSAQPIKTELFLIYSHFAMIAQVARGLLKCKCDEFRQISFKTVIYSQSKSKKRKKNAII